MYLGLSKHKKFARYAGVLLTIAVFVGIFAPNDLEQGGNDLVAATLFGTLILYFFLMAWRKSDLRKILDEYIRQNYYLSFQTLRPEGKNSLEKFMSLAQNVFPTIKKELKEYSKNGLSWENTIDKLDGKYEFDISLKTDDGKFILKYFQDGVKFEDVEKLVKTANKYYSGDDVLRFVILSPKFDEFFFSDQLSNKMEKLMPSKPKVYKTFLSKVMVKKWMKLDLFLERENGYTTIWID